LIHIIDYGVGNLASIQNMVKRAGGKSLISSEPNDIEAAEKIILPGVGAFDTCAEKLRNSGLIETLRERIVERKIPVLGICVGLQLMMSGSEEGKLPGLGWIKGRVVRFDETRLPADHKVPHMGWSDIKVCKQSKFFDGMYSDPRFYFVHAYHPKVENPDDVLVTAEYGYAFAAGVEHENIAGVQFHPEKSHKFGMKLMENFLNL
jgi:glutamine amidotransferase